MDIMNQSKILSSCLNFLKYYFKFGLERNGRQVTS